MRTCRSGVSQAEAVWDFIIPIWSFLIPIQNVHTGIGLDLRQGSMGTLRAGGS